MSCHCHNAHASLGVCDDLHAGCTEGEIRLLGGNNELEGRVEICLNDEWGTVCDQMWDSADAEVVCQQLNLRSDG